MPNDPTLDASVQWRIDHGTIDLREPGYRGTAEAILDAGLATEVRRLISAGKEADVYLCGYNGASLAVKAYRLYRTSHRGGRPIKVDTMSWLAAHEFEMMRQAWKGGAPVPTPARRVENLLSMRYIGNEAPAPRLHDVRLEAPESFLGTVLAGVDALGRFEREALVSEDRVTLLVDFMRVREGLDDFVVRHTEGPRRRRGADREERVTDLLPVPAVEVHHHDRPDAALLPVQRGFLGDAVERVGELVLAPRRGPGGTRDGHRDAARYERLAYEPRALLEARLDRRRVLDHEVGGEVAEGGRVGGEVFVPKVPRQGPILDRGEVRDDVAAAGGQEPERGLGDDPGVHDDRDGRLGREAHLLAVLLDGSPRRHDAVMARRRRHAHEGDARIEGGTLRHVDRSPAADPEGELEGPLADPLLAFADLLPRRVGDDELGDADLAGREFLLDRLARDLQRVLVGDEQSLLPQLQGLADLADLVERVVPDDDVPRELHRFGLVEDLGIQGADGRRLRSASKGVSVLNSDDPSCQIPSDGSHRRASPRNLYGRSVPDARLDGVPPRRRDGDGPRRAGSRAGGGRVPPRERPLRRPRVRGGRRLLRARRGGRLR